MIPYFTISIIQLGPLALQIWGIFLVLGFLVGSQIAKPKIIKAQIPIGQFYELISWLMIGGLIGSRIGYLLGYHSWSTTEPIAGQIIKEIFTLQYAGLSVFGGIFAGLVVIAIFLYRHQAIPKLPLIEALAFAWPATEAISRVGCFVIHDHPGLQTRSYLGVLYPDGVLRYDLGLILALILGFVAISFYYINAKFNPKNGTFLIAIVIIYGLIRFFTDQLRIEPVYGNYPLGSWLGLFFVVGGGVLWIIFKRKNSMTANIVNN